MGEGYGAQFSPMNDIMGQVGGYSATALGGQSYEGLKEKAREGGVKEERDKVGVKEVVKEG
jgi:hypothetical protein